MALFSAIFSIGRRHRQSKQKAAIWTLSAESPGTLIVMSANQFMNLADKNLSSATGWWYPLSEKRFRNTQRQLSQSYVALRWRNAAKSTWPSKWINDTGNAQKTVCPDAVASYHYLSERSRNGGNYAYRSVQKKPPYPDAWSRIIEFCWPEQARYRHRNETHTLIYRTHPWHQRNSSRV